jgi:hypothetical protein
MAVLMKKQLIIVTSEPPEGEKIIRPEVEVFDLRKGEVDYKSLLKKIFEADSVHVW